jgi:hypothetical protein
MGKVRFQVFEVLKDMAKAYGKDSITAERLEIYTNVLVDELTIEELRKAFSKILVQCKFFPSIAEIIELAKPKVDSTEVATIIANEIIECISRFGPYQFKEAKDYLGHKFYVAERFGWSNLCAIQNSEISSTRAQLRELAKAYINQHSREIKENPSLGFSLSNESIESEKKEAGLKLLRF